MCLPTVADVTSGVLNFKLGFIASFCSSFERQNPRWGVGASRTQSAGPPLGWARSSGQLGVVLLDCIPAILRHEAGPPTLLRRLSLTQREGIGKVGGLSGKVRLADVQGVLCLLGTLM